LSTFARLRSSSVLFAIALSLALVPQIGRPATVAASPVHQTTTLARCGAVTYNTAVSPNTLQIGTGPVFQIVAGTTFTMATGTPLATGQNVCVQLTLNALNQITGGTVTANTTTTATACGQVTAYTPSVAATATSAGTAGSITIATTTATVTYPIAPGATRTGLTPAVGANLCFQLTLNGLNQVTNAAVTAGTTAGGNAQICGITTAFTAAGAAGTTTTGQLVIAGQTLTIAPGVVPAGTAITVPGNFCVTFTLNAAGQVASLTVTPNVTAVSYVCGAFVSATSTATGATVTLAGGRVFAAPAAFATAGLVPGQVYCFLLSNGAITGMLTGVPTAATPAATSGGGHRIGRMWAD
jgi:hypothetical protein